MLTSNHRILRATALTLMIVGLLASGESCSPNSSSKSNGNAATGLEVTTFDTADAAVDTLVSAMRTNDEPKLRQILGPDADDILASGDAVADQQRRALFLGKYDEKHSLTGNADGSVTLNIGNEDWPLPIPVVKDADSGKWWFDTDAGKEEILNRRIGSNELNVMQVIKAIGDAETEYAQTDPDGDGVTAYAAKVISDPGKKNGLYWPTKESETPSPLGALVAAAMTEGYGAVQRETGDIAPRPYHGYFYRLLTSQGEHAPGGATDYMVNGRLIAGYGVVAWPAEYGNSGIMTFVVNHSAVVYQKDFGDDTDKVARSMTSYDPDPTWKRVDNSPKP